MKNNTKISFIVPFHNVEKYIAACLDSLYSQDIPEDEYEIICIDDCSPDDSKKIVLEYQKRHSNLILVEHKENKCLGGARNTGIREARGKYLWFVDSDDIIVANCLKALVNLCDKDDLDVLMFNFEKINQLGKVVEQVKVFQNSDVLTGSKFIHLYFENNLGYHIGYVWRQIYRADYLRKNQLNFPEHIFWEDTVFMPKALFYAEKVSSIADAYYQYRGNPTSVSGLYNKELRADLIFQFAFNTGKDLFDFSKEIERKDENIAKHLNLRARWYINSFIFKLLKASVQQKKQFFKLVQSNNLLIIQLKPYMTRLNKILCVNTLGYWLSLIISPAYKIKLMLKKQNL